MKFLNNWKEYGAIDQPSMKEFFQKAPYVGQDKIAAYLRAGNVKLTGAGVSFDFFTHEKIDGKMEILTDGEYSWSSSLPYFIEKYNLRLLPEFEKKVLQKAS